MQPADLRNRPVVLESGSADRPPRRRPWPRTLFGLGTAGVIAAAGVVAGSWSIMSAVGTTTPPGNNAPLWFSPPAPVATTPATPPASVKDTSKGGVSSGAGSHPGEVEPGHHQGGAFPTASHRSSPPSSPTVTVTPTDDHRHKDEPPVDNDNGHSGRSSEGN